MTTSNSNRINQVINRDGCFCHYCGKQLDPNNRSTKPDAITVDHVHALHNGGSNHINNLVLSCRRCNLKKRIKHYQEVAMAVQTDKAIMFVMGLEE